MQHTFKKCSNKGNARIWVEGNRLAENGFHRGDTFTREILSDHGQPTLILKFNSDAKPQGKIAGTDSRPIIDLCGKWVTELFGDHTHYTVDFGDDIIIIHPNSEG